MHIIGKGEGARERRIRQAQDKANQWMNDKMDDLWPKIAEIMFSKIPEIANDRELHMKQAFGTYLSLSFAMGFIEGVNKKKLFTPTGEEI